MFQIEIDKTAVGSDMIKTRLYSQRHHNKKDDQLDILKVKDFDATLHVIVSIFPAGQTIDDVNSKGSMIKQNLFLFCRPYNMH